MNEITLRIFFYSLRATARQFIGFTPLRRIVLIIGALLLPAAILLGVFLGMNRFSGLNDLRSLELLQRVSEVFFLFSFMIIFIPCFVLTKYALILIKDPESLTLVSLSPQGVGKKFIITFGPGLFYSSYIYILLFTPFIVGFLFLNPFVSFGVLLYNVIVSGWATTLSIASLVLLVDLTGKRTTLYLVYIFPMGLATLPYLFSLYADDLRGSNFLYGSYYMSFFVASIFILPPLFLSTIKAFYNLIEDQKPIEVAEFRPAKWGKFNPWILIDREVSNWFLVTQLLLIGFAISRIIDFGLLHNGIVASLVLSFIINPVDSIMRIELKQSFRWKLAPNRQNIKNQILVQLVLPMLFVGLSALVYVGYPNSKWVVLVSGIVLLAIAVIMTERLFNQNIIRIFLIGLFQFTCIISPLIFKD